MGETMEVIGTIEDKSSKEGDNWTKHTFKIEKEDGKGITLGMFVNEGEEAKESLAKQFKKGMSAKFFYYDQEKDGVVYHNIINIQANSAPTEEVADSSAKATAKAPTYVGELERQRLIVRQSCLSNALKYFDILKSTGDIKDFSQIQVKDVAAQFEEWVWRK